MCDSDNDFVDEEELERPVTRKESRVGNQWMEFFRSEDDDWNHFWRQKLVTFSQQV